MHAKDDIMYNYDAGTPGAAMKAGMQYMPAFQTDFNYELPNGSYQQSCKNCTYLPRDGIEDKNMILECDCTHKGITRRSKINHDKCFDKDNTQPDIIVGGLGRLSCQGQRPGMLSATNDHCAASQIGNMTTMICDRENPWQIFMYDAPKDDHDWGTFTDTITDRCITGDGSGQTGRRFQMSDDSCSKDDFNTSFKRLGSSYVENRWGHLMSLRHNHDGNWRVLTTDGANSGYWKFGFSTE
jgi:hypothetical protein